MPVARVRFGLHGEVADAVRRFPDAAQCRYEVTTAYHTRYRELLMAHVSDHGELPADNAADSRALPTLGKLSI